MDREELIERLKGYEWDDLEFKRARRGVPEDAYRTVSAFSNTQGGRLVFGVQDKAGIGLRVIFGNQRQLGHVPPVISNDRVGKSFEITLLKEELVSERQRLLQAKLGVRLSDAESGAFAFACRERRLRPGDVRAVTGLSGGDVRAVLDRLTAQALISPLEGSQAPLFVPAPHLEERFGELAAVEDIHARRDGPSASAAGERGDADNTGQGSLSTAQPPVPTASLSTAQPPATTANSSSAQPPATTANLSTAQPPVLTRITAMQDRIIRLCDTPRRLGEIMAVAGVKNRGHFKKRHLNPLLHAGVLRMTHPGQPNHPHQAYVLTPAGAAIKACRGTAAAEDETSTNGDGADAR